ncbi:MAG TPA: EamA family transporter RarD [Propionibacteriaceae bacterium]|nr:EamA family transporter RarD [Propionibacteriaceae bacterium]
MTTPATASDGRASAVGIGASTYVVWGLLTLYWPLLRAVPALEILSHRIVWSLVLVGALLLVSRRGWRWLAVLRTRDGALRMLAAATFIAINWLTYIWAVNSGHVVEASLGYYLNPLVNVALGVVIFREHSSPATWLGFGVATAGVALFGSGASGSWWIPLVLAFAFGFYGAIKKASPVSGLEGLAIESGVLVVPALVYLIARQASEVGAFGTDARTTWLLALSGPATVLPLWLFAKAAPRIPLGVLGMLQYIAPTITLILAVAYFREDVGVRQWIGLGLVWLGSLLYLIAMLRRSRPGQRELHRG